MNLEEMKRKVKKAQDKERYEHTLGVMYTASCLAMAHNYDIEKATIAGLLHDCAKCIPNDEKIDLCKKYNIETTQVERENPSLLHAKLGAAIAKDKYKINDSEILHAIEVHTTGAPKMSLLDKIIFIADYMEPGRDKAPNLGYIRKLAFQDLNACLAEILYDTLMYLSDKKSTIDPTTQLTYEFYKEYKKEN